MSSTTHKEHMDEIDWPPGFDRTPPGERERTSRFDTRLRASIDDLVDELERLGVDDWRLSTGARHQKQNPRYPYADANPDDPGAVVRWTMGGDQYAVACDRYTSLRDNIRSMFYYIREKRKMENRPVVTGESEFTNLRLPSGDEDAVAVTPTAYQTLGVSPDATDEEIREAWRARVKETHPDNGGDPDEHQRVKEAREELLG